MEHRGSGFEADCQDEEGSVSNSIVDESSYYRSTVLAIPEKQDIIRMCGIPLVINVVLENYEEEGIPLCSEDIVRCECCKSYLNPFVEIIPPGLKWRCNVCLAINDLATAFQVTSRTAAHDSGAFDPRANAAYNSCYYSRTELRSTVYELEAPPNYSLKTPSPPFICFLIEVTFESMKCRAVDAVIRSILGGLDPKSFDPRSRMMFAFFDSSIYLLKKNGDFSIISDATYIPFFLEDDFLLPLDHHLDVARVERFFIENKSTKNNYGDALRVVQSILGATGGCIISFLATHPNMGSGSVDPSQRELRCKSVFYKEMSAHLSKQGISVTQFLFPRLGIELPTLSVLNKYTGGMLYYYPNFDGSDPAFTTKLANDLASHLDLNTGLHGMCRVRASRCVFIKEYFGSLHHRSADLLSFSTFFPPHSLNFEIDISKEEGTKGVCFQVAILRTLRTGERRIRVVNFCIDRVSRSLYSVVDPYAIAHALALKAFFFESRSKGGGNEYLNKSMKDIIRAYKQLSNTTTLLPATLEVLPMLVLSLCKSIPLRPVSYTPMDYKSYYIYLITNSYPKLVDTVIYPTLLALHRLDTIQPLNLTLDCLETNGLYLLDTGVTIFFFVARNCDPSLPDLLFDPSIGSERFIFDPERNEFSDSVCKIIEELRSNRYLTPNYVLVRDNGASSVYKDIFFTYFVEDESHGLPSYSRYLDLLRA
ncbi:similarity to SEC24-related protein (COPII coat) [Encephalitozoon cuniculi GB-M1]|uniref:Similarity to SEC24-related protein (COPII coat) n=2 Tax=Encephalitozoon cuniculi TaxID=6035 RepID=Q8SWA5_ENCCU|nr:Sec23/Sec24-like protein [Encephalitozoon cuniculi GB-M1]AGE95512.1 sec24-related protein [Encephalitozoon cuniculi]KMV66641.1 Sec23/Sec24-like protein [Encephalitozoon cuniculi EcunIII-L]UYI28316.1 protein transport protein SEC24A [Encephalitozoon cuniculi]CAD25152.1 similarity to SEC24-related protein (COPII coat) [Encephalitozoon cuniculi GB-M1]